MPSNVWDEITYTFPRFKITWPSFCFNSDSVAGVIRWMYQHVRWSVNVPLWGLSRVFETCDGSVTTHHCSEYWLCHIIACLIMLTVELFRRECNTNVVALFAGSEKTFLSSVITIRKCKYQISPEYSFQSCNEPSAEYIRCDIAICWENTLHLPSYLFIITYQNHIIWRLAAHLYASCWSILNIYICKQQLLHLSY